CVFNLARSAQPVELDLSRYKGRVPVELMGRTPFPPLGDLPYLLTLPGYGFLWFRLAQTADIPDWHEPRAPVEELPVLVLFDGWPSFSPARGGPGGIGMAERVRARLEREILPAYVAKQRWFAGKGDALARLTLSEYALWSAGDLAWMLAIFRAEREGEEPQ